MHRHPAARRRGPRRSSTQVGTVLVLLTSLVGFFSWAGAAAAGTQPGSVTCSQVTGRLTFAPPLTQGGSASEVASLALVLKGCLAVGGGSSPSVAHGAGILPMTANTCASLASRTRGSLEIAISWRPTTDGSTTVAFPGFTPTTGTNQGLHMGGRHTSAAGSYAGTDGGARSVAAMTFGSTPTRVASACASSTGLKRLKVQSGFLTVA